MMLWKNCLAATLLTAAAAFVAAHAQTTVEGVVQPAIPASQPVVHAVPVNPPQAAPQVPSQAIEQPASPPAQKSAEKPVQKPAHKPAHKLAEKPAPEPYALPTGQPMVPQPDVPLLPAAQPVEHQAPTQEPPLLPAPGQQPAMQPAPTPQPAMQAAPAPQPAMQPAPQPLMQPVVQPAQQPAPTPQPYAQPAPAPVPAPPPSAQPAPSPTPQPYAQPAEQRAVNWTLQVIRNGQLIDSFDGTTTVGQAHTDTHHKVVSHDVGCKDQPAGSIDLQRTITVSPLRANPTESILAIDAQETLEDDAAPSTPEGCKLPPQPRQVQASHPGLVVPAGQWVSWPIINKDPALAYRVRATLAPPSQQP